MDGKVKLPVGIEDFETIRKDGFYYIDKTGLIKELLENMSYVNLFTRPRRFGKTLTMSMLKKFFEADGDSALFDGLEISKEKEICKKYMGKFPVISISLKDVSGDTFDTAKRRLCSTLAMEAERFSFLADSGRLTEAERRQYTALKTNSSLYFAVLTGCLRISKESIFTGFNNFNVYTVKDVQYNEFFGFLDREVMELLEYYGFTGKYAAVKEWYDGYRFGKLEVYCPWDVVNYCHALKMDPSVHPQNYWVNTSSNSIIRKFIEKADGAARDEMELLISGKSIRKKIRQELTYRDLDSMMDNLWSILFTTGYLTQCEEDGDGLTSLVIPNREIRWIFVEQIQEWFEAETKKDMAKLENFCRAFEKNDTEAIEKGFASYLRKTISIRDTNVRKEMKENFYHGVLLGLFAGMNGWKVRSNAESGEGYSDISVEVEDKEIGIIIEFKYAEKAAFDAGCREALKQIDDRNYEEALLDDGMRTIYKYGIACYKKRCKVISEQGSPNGGINSGCIKKRGDLYS